MKSVEANPDLDLYSYLDEVALYTDLDNYDRAEDAAVMMTMHAAKGLEFPVVFIIGAEEGLFPSMQAIGQSEDMEEERRLCYVAITRAREKLYITCAAQRMLYGRTSANLPSRFTEEIPQTLLDRQGLAKKKANLWDDDGTFISGRSGTWGGGLLRLFRRRGVLPARQLWHELCCTHRTDRRGKARGSGKAEDRPVRAESTGLQKG